MSEELHRSIGRLEGKLDTAIDMLKHQSGRHDGLEGRVRSVERKATWYSGAAAAFGAIVSLALRQH